MNFADRLDYSIQKSKSVIVAGLDPNIEALPRAFQETAGTTSNNEEAIYKILTVYYRVVLDTLTSKIPAIKPNLAFFEQYGLGGIRAFYSVCAMARERQLLVIADAKRGDIGSTAEAYARAYLGSTLYAGKNIEAFPVDALTVNPFLGFDTLEPFIDQCAASGRGMYVLVRTSNPGSAALQTALTASGEKASDEIAKVLAAYAPRLSGDGGLSSLGAVVGATYPEELKRLRGILATNILLVPGVGAQGGTMQDAAPAFLPAEAPGTTLRGALVNLSRALFQFPTTLTHQEELTAELTRRINYWNSQGMLR